MTTCPFCGSVATGNFCSACGASLAPRSCQACRAELSPQARFCHRCGRPVGASDRRAWMIAAGLCVLLVGGLVYKVSSSAPRPVTPDMANAGASGSATSERAPDISNLTPRERFDRLFNRIMQSGERGDSVEVRRFTPMALGAYEQLDTVDVDARYHAAVLQLQVGDVAAARALADTILAGAPGHLFGYVILGESARLQKDPAGLARAERDFLSHYPAEAAAKRVEYLEHQPVLEEFKREAERAGER